MGRKEHLQEGLHEIKRKKRVEVKADKKKNPRLKTKRKMRRSTKIATLCLVVSLVACAYSVGLAFFRDPSRNLVNLDYGSVSSAVESGETYSPDRGYSPVDIFARLNWTFSRQKRWYGEMHGTVDTVIQQEIETYKQYDNGILVSADLTKSSLVSGASQFCYLKDEDLVMWRKPVGNASTYRGLETEWQTGEPYRIMTINGEDGFKAKNGLPAYELSVYVIEENTILEASDVNMTEDGLYKISYSLKPETWQEEENGALVTKGATAYYANQMIFTGGLPEAPVFESINVAFTFDKNWRVFKTEIVESYNAKYGPIAAGCVSTSETKYEYDTERAVSSAYEEYFKQYLGASVDVNGGGTGEKEVTALNCLAEAFGSVLTGPVSLDLDLTLNGTPQKGVVNLDLGGLDLSAPDLTKVSAKARLGAIGLWVQDGKAYIDYGGMKFSLKIEELVSLFGDAIAPEEGESDLLGALAGGEFTVEGSEATLSSVLPIAGVEIPVKFFFKLDENRTASLDHVETEIEIKEKLAVGAKLSFGDETLGEIENEEEYVDVLPYAQSLIGLFGSDVLHLDAEYSGDGVQVKGGFDLKVKDGFALFGKLDLGLEKDGISLAKTAELLYTDGEIFVTLDGIKVKANIEETLALLSGYFELPELSLPEAGTLDLAKILNAVLSEEFASRFESTKSENLLVLLVEGTELLRAFGVEFDLGTVRLSVGDDALSVDALGAKIALTAGTEFDISTDGYVDILKYASTVIELIQSEVLHAEVAYKTEKLSVAGTIDFDVKELVAKANLTLKYEGISKSIELIYKDNAIYITLDGLKLSANVEQAIALVDNFVEIPANDTDSKELINQLLSLNFGDVIKLSESDDTLTAAIDGTKLLETLGLTFDLGQATVKIGNDQIDLAVLGANVTLTSGAPFDISTDGYVDILKYASTVIELIQSEVLHADVAYKTDNLEIAGTIDFNVKNVIAKADLTLTYGEIEKAIGLIYKDNVIYITLDGLKLSANVEQAIGLVQKFVEIPANDTDSKELVNNLLSLNFGDVIKLSEENDTLTAAIDGTKLLEALGLTFDLGEATVKIGTDKIDLAVLGANVTLTKGAAFEANTDGFIDVVKYAETVIELIQSEVLHANVSYKTDELSVAGTIDFDIEKVLAKANLTLTYGEIEKAIELVYKENIIYITLDGLKLSANVEQAIALVEKFVAIPENDTDSKELINQLLSLNLGEVIKLSESDDTLTAAIDGTKLLKALGLTFELGEATVKIGNDQIDLAVYGANVTLTKGNAFEANTDDFIDVVKYASTVIELIQSEVLHANVSYSTDNLEIVGTIDFDVEELIAKAQLTLTYNGIAKAIELIYKENTIYITLDGLKLSAKVDEAIALVENFVESPESDTDSKELINNLLSLNFGEVIKLSESEDTLTAAIDGTKLLEALGLTFDLGEAQVKIGASDISLEVYGANVTLTKGETFETNTDDFIDVVKYAETVIELIQSEVLHAEVEYKTEKLEIAGTIDFDVKELVAKANLTLTYDGIEKTIELIYKDNVIYITLDGLKLSAKVEQAIGLVEKFIEIPANDTDSKELINNLLSLNFGEVIELSESNDTLTAAIDGTKLLEALGLTFDLGQATVKIGTDKIDLAVLGANVTLTAGTSFDVSTDGYVDVLKYASTVIELIQSEVLHANVTYKTDELSVAGTIDFDIEKVLAKANLTLTYGEIEKAIELVYKENIIYITLDGLKLSANVEQAIALVEKFVEIPEGDTDSNELINKLLNLNFGEFIKLSESEDTLTAAIDGTKLLKALGLTFDLGQAQVKIGNDQIALEVYGANVTLTKGAEFETNTDDFIDVVKYAETVIELIQSDILHANVSYKTDKLSVTGTIDFDVKSVIAKANLKLTYNGISKEIELIYKDNIIYITLDGLKLSANVEQAIGLVEKFVEIPANDTDSKELINQLLSLNFGEIIKLSESNETLTAAIDGTKLLEALGLTFELGEATVKIGTDKIELAVLDANLTLTKGAEFKANTDNFIDVVKYAETVIELIQSEVLHADVAYKTEKLAIEGKIDFDVEQVLAKAQLTLTYGEISKKIELIYLNNNVYVTLDGLKLSANVEQAIALVENFVAIPASDTDSKELINNLLSLNFSEVIELSESEDTLTAAIDGTKLLEALGLKFDLGDATVKIGTDQIALEVLGAEVTLTLGKAFEANTDNFIDVVKYASTIIELIQSEVLHADVSYKTGKLEIAGTIDLDVKNVIAKANLTLTYNGISKEIELIYKDSTIYITLDGLKLSANVEQAIGLVQKFVAIPANDTDSNELINNLLSLNFGDVIKLSESNDTLTAAIDGTKLLEALGLTFDLGEATVKIGTDKIDLAVLGANVTLTKGKAFEANTDNFIDVVRYAETVIELIQSDVLHANVSYSTDKLEIAGTIDFDVKNVIAKADLTLTYGEIEKAIGLIYKDNVIYITLDGLKLSANVEQAIGLVQKFVEIPASDTDSKELINNLLSLNFGEVIKLSESNDTLTAAIDGTKLLEALGLTFDLGEATVKIGTDKIDLEVLGAKVVLTSGKPFEANTDNFIDVVKYAETVIELIQSDVLHANVSYKTDELSVTGTIDFDVKNVIAKADLTLTYGEIEKAIELIYKDGTIYITLDGLKLSAKVDEAIALVENFVEIPASDTDSKELINQLLSLNFGDVIKLSEENDTLTAAIDGTKLLKALGLKFDLGQATVKIGNDQIDLAVLGANVTLTSGKAFEANTDNFIDVVKYASTVIELIQSEVLHADVEYKTDKLEIVGTIDFDIEQVLAKANLTLTYNGIAKEIELIYKDGTIFITLDGLKLSAKVDEAIALVEKFVEIPEGDTDSKELINNLLSLNFGEVIKLSEENDTLTAAIDGTKLLETLGLKFDLGQATVKIGASDISLEVYGANVTLTSGTQFEANTDDFIDVVKYASTVIELIQSDVLHANVSYKTDNLEIAGTIDFNVKNVIAKANLTLTYDGIEKAIELVYKDNIIYITFDGLKLSAKVDEAIALVENFVEIPENDTDSNELINNLLSLNFGEVIKLSESDDTLTAAIDGTKLLETLGLKFDLGQATVKIDTDQIALEVLGANVTLTAGTQFEANTDNFIDVVKYASSVIELIQSDVLHADVSYKTDELSVTGTIDFDVKSVIAKANLTLTYNGIEKTIELIYKDSTIYITLDGLKLSANVEEAIALVENFVAIPANDTDSKELINQLLSLNFGDIIKLSEENDTLTAAIDGTKLLEALGLKFELGNATVKIGTSDISLEVLGANVTLTKGEKFDASTDGFIDLAPVLEKIGKIVQNGGLELRGILTLDTENGEIVLEIRRAAISWKDGFKLYLDATLSVAGTAHDVKLYADKTMAKIVYGNVGVEIVYEEVKGLEAKFLQVYDRIADIVNGSFKTESGALLPKAETMKELLTSLLGKVEDTTGTLGNESMQQLFEALQSSGSFLGAFDSVKESSFGSFDLSEILGSLVLSSVLNEGTATGCITAEYKGLKLGVSTAFAQLNESLPAMVQANISYAGEDISLRESTVYLCELTSFPEMPNITYLCYEDYCELLDFFGAAITTLAEKNVGLDLSGKVLSTDEKYSAFNGEKYTFDASVRFYSGAGEGFPITIDTINKSISVRSDMYLKVHLTLSSKVETGLWLDLIVMDMDPNGKTDGKLDFFVSISKYEEGSASRSPLSFYAPASEVKTLLSAACILLGVDNSILNDYLIEKGLSLDTRSQLRSIGDSLQLASLISGLVGKNDEPAEFAEILEGANREENLKRNYLSKFSFEPTRNENGAINGNTLTLALNGKAIYNDANADDIELVLEKQGESFVSSRLTKVALSGVTSGSESFSFKLGFSYDEIKEEEKTNIKVTHNFDGVERLITSIAKSATHTATNEEIISGEAKAHDFVLNKTFYIDGTANVSALSLVKAEIKVIAISVTIDEENKVAVNLRLEYDGKHVVVPLINGHSIVDITIKGGMVYMKRVQTNYYDFQLFGDDWTDYATPITIYRTTTLSNFFDDILKHLGFLLNFGDSIVSAIEKSEPAQPADTTALDYGALVGQYFVGYECKHQDGGEDTWTINLNGNALTDGVLGEIGITFTADKNDIVKDLHVSTKLYSIISLTLDLNWRNPQSADDYAGNQTDRKFADELASKQDGIGEMLETHDFASERFIEYQKGTINYSYHKYHGGDESLGSSDVYYRMSDRTLLNEPHVPDLEAYNNEEFYLEWDNNTFYHKGGTFPNEGATVTATQKAHMYNVTFVTSNEQAGTLPSGYSWTQDGDNKFFTAQMKYNATVKFTANGTTQSRTVDGNSTIELPDATQFHNGAEGEWNLNSFAVDKAEFTAFYPLTVRYKSAIAYNADGNHNADENYDVRVENSDYKLITPTASGYTFLGWFTQEGGNWREAKEIASSTVIDGKLMLKVEALWMKSGFLTIKTSKQQRSEWYLRTTYTHSATLTVHEECLVGAFAKEAGLVKSYRYWLHFDNKKDTPTSYDHSGNTYSEDKMWPAGFDYAHGKVEATFKLNSGFEFTYTETTIGQF